MRLVIISTTIHGEKGYLPFDRLLKGSKFTDAMFVIAGDVGAAPFDTSRFQCPIEYLDVEAQKRFHISETIGWKTPRRRPIAWLRAIELKPDYILSVDDDNIPADDYFDRWYEVLMRPVKKVVIQEEENSGKWHNYLRSADAPFEMYPRGFPIPFRKNTKTFIVDSPAAIFPSRVGLYQGISLGDPDIDAVTRLVYPKPMPLSSIKEKNYCLKDIWSPYNMQNTVFSKTLFGLPILWPHVGRFDDIYASFTWQKLLFNNDMFVHVGDPVNRQDRGARDILNGDFREEVEGYFHSHHVWEAVSSIQEKEAPAFLEKLLGFDDGVENTVTRPVAYTALHSFFQHPVANSPLAVLSRNRPFFNAYIRDIEKII